MNSNQQARDAWQNSHNTRTSKDEPILKRTINDMKLPEASFGEFAPQYMSVPSFYGQPQPYAQHQLVHHQTTFYTTQFHPYKRRFIDYHMVPPLPFATNMPPYYYQPRYYHGNAEIHSGTNRFPKFSSIPQPDLNDQR